jgi:O-antigen ligase
MLSITARRSEEAPSISGQGSPVLERVPLRRRGLAFLFGFCIQFDVFIGGSGQGASATGGYGYHLIDFVALGTTCLLGIHALVPVRDERMNSFIPYRILPIALYGLIVVSLFVLPAQSVDPRTAILAYHYMLYSLAALYLAVIVNDVGALEQFCWGLIIGLLATVPIFIAQDSVYASKLIEWGLTPGFAQEFGDIRGLPRYSGLWAHPNEAGHAASLAAAAGAYFALVQRRFWAVALVSAGLIAVFYYTGSRGGLLCGGAILAIPFVIARGKVTLLRFIVMSAILVVSLALAAQLDFVASRFGDDPNATKNVSDRLDSILSGLQLLLTHPFGMSIYEFISSVGSASGGVESPHNGFIFLTGVFGVLPLIVVLAAFASNLIIRDEVDVFFALFTVQISLSFMFEQLPESYSYAFPLCFVCARAFVRTRTGSPLLCET